MVNGALYVILLTMPLLGWSARACHPLLGL
jgi:cytochrome b561